MKRIATVAGLLLLGVTMVGCFQSKPLVEAVSETTPPAKVVEEATSVKTEEEASRVKVSVEPASDSAPLPFDYAAMTDDVFIQLDEEPRIHSPIHTLVAPEKQIYTVFFREPMNRASVQEAMQKNANQSRATAEMHLQWVGDRQVRVQVQAAVDETQYDVDYYLSFNGAQTEGGRVLENVPELIASVEVPRQLWRVSVDGKQREQLTSFAQPFDFRENDLSAGRYLHLGRVQRYCQCDAMYPRLHALYDLQEKKVVPYPIDLMQTYRGEGAFYADPVRGVFYAKAPDGVAVPTSDTVSNVQVDGYVFGASFSQDRAFVLLAVGANREQKSDYTFLLHSLTGAVRDRKLDVLPGGVPLNQASGGEMPIRFEDDGERVYVLLTKPNTNEMQRYLYNWGTGKGQVLSWKGEGSDPWFGFKRSSDGLYTLYTDGRVVKGEQEVAKEMNLYNSIWLPGTHSLITFDYESEGADEFHRLQLKRFDVETKQYSTIAVQLLNSTQLIGASEDGKWLYVSSSGKL